MPIEMNGVQAWITVDNKVQLVEYQVDLDLSSNTATCWISGEPGQVCLPFTFLYIRKRSPAFIPFNSGPVRSDNYDKNFVGPQTDGPYPHFLVFGDSLERA